MLNKENYVPWSSRLLRYEKSRPNGKLIHNSIINGPYVRRIIPEPGDPNCEVPMNETFHVQTDDELTKKELKQIEADDQAIQTILLGLPEDIYAAVNSCETAQEICEISTFQKRLPEVDELKAKQFAKTQDPLAFMKTSNNLYTFPMLHQDQPSFNQNYMQQPMPNLEDITDPITAMNMALALMDKAFKLNYLTPTKNNQRISSNPHNRQIAKPGMNMGQDRQMQMVGGNINQKPNGNGNLVAVRSEGNETGHNGNQIRCYNCRGVGHFARNCMVRPMRRDAAYLQTQLLIAQKEEAGIQLQAEEFDLMAAAADLDEIKEVNANCILMANLQQASTSGTQTNRAPVYDSDGSAENDNNVIYEVTSVEQSRETVEQIPINVEETHLNKQLSKEKSMVSFLLEEKKKLKSDFKIREDELLDKKSQLEKRIKELDNILVKMGQSIQTIHMLSPKPDSFYHTKQKMALGYQNPFYLKQAQQKQQSLYDGKVLLEKHDPPISGEELYFSNTFKTATVSKPISILNEECLDDTTPSVARKFLNEVKSTIVTLQHVVKHRMTLDTYNWSSSAHQELHKIVKDENFLIVNQVDARVQNFEIQFLKEAAKFVGDFKSLAKEADESLAKHNALELEIERFLRAVASQDIMSVVQNNYVGETSNLQSELERTKEHFENCIIKKENEYAKLWNDWYKKCEECKFDKISYDKAYNDMQQKTKRLQAQLRDLKGKITSNLIPTPQESKVVKNDKVITPECLGLILLRLLGKKSMCLTKIASVRSKPIIVSQPPVITKKDVNSDSNGLSSTGIDNTKTRRPQPRSNTKNDRVPSVSKSSCNKNKGVEVEEHHKNLLLSKNKKHMSSACNTLSLILKMLNLKLFVLCTQKANVSINEKQKKQQPQVIQICLWCVDSGCSKHMTGNLKLFINFVWKFLGTVRFENDHVAAILGFSDLQWGNILITRVYFVEGLGHNLFSVGQFCDSDLEVAFRRNACFVRNLKCVDLLSGNRTTTLYTINLHEMASASPICLMARASSTKSWLWHQCLSHLNFDTINNLAKNNLVTGLPKFKYHKEHLCSSSEQGKSKRASHPPKPVLNSRQRLHLLHMDLCGSMRIASINGKRYVLVIMDDYSRYTWVQFLRSKDEASEVIKTFLKRITILLQSHVIIIRTDNGTEFKNQVLKEYFDIEATRTMLIFSRAPLFLWAEVIATAYFNQNRSIIHRRFNKTPYKLINGRKLDISFFHVFGALCYPKNDREDTEKLSAKGDIGLFICYSADSCAFRVYNRRTKKIMETMNVSFDELSAMDFEQRISKPGLQSMTFGQISLGLDLTHAPSTITTQQPTEDTAPTPTNSSSEAINFPNSSHDVDGLRTQQPHAQQQGNQASLHSKTVVDNVSNAMFDANSFVNPFATSSISAIESSSSPYVDPSNMHTFYQPYPHEFQWTKDHPLEQVIGEPSRPVLTRNQLRSDGDMCIYTLTVSTMEPKNVKEAMTDPAWIESMQEELLQFKRMDVWVLVSAPDNISHLTLKWIFKNKND
uniref:Retrovirus-related Pol polyprotein from transposon TNT 1-94 n=1 Tax=Tanacetum cinerariifolium TaxID=118510 RepID=A0A6L2KMA9_TANCI|nr:retrovirus-related Pol polyprotein from transposon TNT 1-94 [Tanacetum cinerariifolium]